MTNQDSPLKLAHIEEYRKEARRLDDGRWIVDVTSSPAYLRIAMYIDESNYFESRIPYNQWFFRLRVWNAKRKILKRVRLIQELKG